MPAVQDVRDVLISDLVLTQIAVSYRPTGLVGTQVLKPVGVRQSAGRIVRFGKEAFRLEPAARGVGSHSRRIHWTTDWTSYLCTEYSLEIAVDDRIVANSINPIEPFERATITLVDMLALAQEKRIFDACFNALGTGYFTTPTNKWDASGSNPISDIKTAIRIVQARIGARPTTVVMSRAVWDVLIEHSVVTDRLKFTTRDFTPEILAQWLDVREILISEALIDTAVEGATENLQYVWLDHVLIAYVPENPAINEPAFGYSPTVRNFTVERYRDEPAVSTIIRCRHETAEVITAVDAGYMLRDVLAAI
ncbi:MAG: major capsid protein [Armatimonadota bacterium]|nr:major capsid protein [Armatimonadota bacterium]MDW8143958.1 major capsid protein [Armatimonadota bacterium]